MSQYRLGKYAKSILMHLVLEGQAVQLELPGIVGCSYRTVVREVGNLRMAGYVEHDVGLKRDPDKGLERKRGKPRFVLRPTFFGVLEIFVSFDKNPENLSKIVERFRDNWVVFEEWDYIAANKELVDLTLSAIKEWMTRNTFPTKVSGRIYLQPEILHHCKYSIMMELLWGSDPIKPTTAGLIFEHDTLAYFKKNPKLKEYMDECVKVQSALYKMRLTIIEAWSEGKLMSEVLKGWSPEPKRNSNGRTHAP